MPPLNLKVKNQLLLTYGILAILVFLLILLIGGLFSDTNKLIFSEISFLLSPYSPNHLTSIRLFQIYNLLILSFSLLLGLRLRNNFSRLGAVYLLLSALFGLILIEYPMDPQGLGDTTAGILHIINVSLISIYIMIALQLFAKAFQNTPGLRWLAKYTFLTSLIILIGGALTGLSAALSLSRFVGIIEKLPIAAFLVWIFRTGLALVKNNKSA